MRVHTKRVYSVSGCIRKSMRECTLSGGCTLWGEGGIYGLSLKSLGQMVQGRKVCYAAYLTSY